MLIAFTPYKIKTQNCVRYLLDTYQYNKLVQQQCGLDFMSNLFKYIQSKLNIRLEIPVLAKIGQSRPTLNLHKNPGPGQNRPIPVPVGRNPYPGHLLLLMIRTYESTFYGAVWTTLKAYKGARALHFK